MVTLNGSFDYSNDVIHEILLFGDSLVSTDVKVIGYNEGITLRCTDGNCFDTILGNVDGITLWLDVGTKLGTLDKLY